MLQFEDVCVMSNLYEVQHESTYNAIGVSDRCECDGLSVVVLPKSGSVRFFEDFCEPGTGPMVRFRQMSEPWTGP